MDDRGPQGPPNIETMLRVGFDPAQRREGLVARLLELRTLIPQFEQEKARIEGMVTLLDEISPPVQQFPSPVITEGTDSPPGAEDDDGSNGKPKPGE